MKRPAFEDGDVFEIFLSKRLYAYCRLISRGEYEFLYELFDETFKKPQDVDALKAANLTRIKVLFINKYSLKNKKKARLAGNIPLTARSRNHPPIFRGEPYSCWLLETKKGIRRLPPSTTYEKLLAKGYVDTAIFATESIVKFYLKDKPLVFEPHLTPLPKHLRA